MSSLPDPDQLLTKDHLDLRLRAEFADFRTEMFGEMNRRDAMLRDEMGALRAEMRGEMGDLRAEMRGEMGALRTDVVGEMGDLRADLLGEMRTLSVDQTKWLVSALLGSIFAFGSLLVAAMAVLG